MITRREFLRATGAAAGLTIAFELSTDASASPSAVFEPNAFLKIGADGKATLYAIRLEMGQGVRTLLPAMLAEELDIDWKDVTVASADGRRFRGVELHTSGSSSSRDTFTLLRKAGAAAREMLVRAAADTWGVDPSSCTSDHGKVIHGDSRRSLAYGKLVAKAASLPVPENPHLKEPPEYKTLGKPIKRSNGKEIVTGAVRYGMDVRLPGMLFASVSRAPTLGARLKGFDAKAALAIPGVVRVLSVKSGIHPGVAVVAKDTWTALKARAALTIEWEKGPAEDFDSDRFLEALPKALGTRQFKVRHEGDDARERVAKAEQRFEASYVFPFQAHAPLEPMNCTAYVKKDSVEVWAPTQTDVRSIEQAAKVAAVPKDRVELHCLLMGGGFGRRLFADYVAEAVELSRALNRPVQLVHSREDDMRHGYFQPATAERFSAALDAHGRITALVHDTTNSLLTIYPIHEGHDIWRDPPNRDAPSYEADQTPWGAYDTPYAFPSLRVDCTDVTTPVPTGPWRAVEYPSTVFGRESFLDELAHRANIDPFTYRLELLPPGVKEVGPYKIDRTRLRKVLETARERSGWQQPIAAENGWRRGRGVAANVYHAQSYIAQIAEVSVAEDASSLRVDRILTVVDCGRALNPLGVEGQTESGIAWGLSATLLGKMDFKHGAAVQSSYRDFGVLRIDQMPRIETVLLDSGASPGGYGEHPVPLVAPAVANAVFAACGRRIRKLPITPEALRG
jgi:isoquinoline 1-oxidoreductase beta subunit